jgi:hypothetical protein
MKILLGCLMCSVLTMSQSFAISGGPVYPGSLNVVGTFAGIMQPSVLTKPCGRNSLGVFSIGVPDAGISSGIFVMFSQGQIFSGTIQGTADPGNATLKAILEATFGFTITELSTDPVTGQITTTETQGTATANGTLDTDISTSSQFTLGVGATRLDGTAKLNISHGELDQSGAPIVNCRMDLAVAGFKQSDTVSTFPVPPTSPTVTPTPTPTITPTPTVTPTPTITPTPTPTITPTPTVTPTPTITPTPTPTITPTPTVTPTPTITPTPTVTPTPTPAGL